MMLVTARKRSLGQGNIFTPVCHSVHRGGCMFARGWGCVVAGGHAWLPGGVCGCQGACVVAGGHAWLPGGMCGSGGCAWLQGCAWLWGGMHGCHGGCMVRGACVVARGYAWLLGGMHGSGGWGACVVGGVAGCVGYDEIRSMSGRYASYWNAFLFNLYLMPKVQSIKTPMWLNNCVHRFKSQSV